ncbi:transposase [Corynebacterium sp.]|uniref:transposase n=1 Tax=Corynebacterium sp. TaxID=1720 RepID=UPI0037BF5F1C
MIRVVTAWKVWTNSASSSSPTPNGPTSNHSCRPLTVGGVDRFATTAESSKASSCYFRAGIAWRDLPDYFGPWQTVWKRHRRYAADGTWDAVLSTILADADAAGDIDWTVSVDATINRAHQHATNTTRPEQHTGGAGELHESGILPV